MMVFMMPFLDSVVSWTCSLVVLGHRSRFLLVKALSEIYLSRVSNQRMNIGSKTLTSKLYSEQYIGSIDVMRVLELLEYA